MDGKGVSPWICRKNHFNYQSTIKRVGEERPGKEGIFAPINSLLDGNEARKRKWCQRATQLAALHFDYMNINFASARIDFARVFSPHPEARANIFFRGARGGISITIIVKDIPVHIGTPSSCARIRKHDALVFIKNYQHRKLIFT